ncbi:MAG: hypothetical protein QNJ67_06605 [Kiloniellales bacterium]|nr:hypothetical protein [Kiloniellales bacterium]
MQDEAAQLGKLLERVRTATGADRSLDSALVDRFGAEPGAEENPPRYTASTDLCIALVHRVMPGWHWHVGYGPKGILPYATVSTGDRLYEAIAGTVPLALLSALIQARAADVGRG